MTPTYQTAHADTTRTFPHHTHTQHNTNKIREIPRVCEVRVRVFNVSLRGYSWFSGTWITAA